MRPVGDLYAFQATLIATAAAFVGVWWLLIPSFGVTYRGWRTPYLGLLGFLLCCEALAFAAPLHSFCLIMTSLRNTPLG
jgi:hypothetical protein